MKTLQSILLISLSFASFGQFQKFNSETFIIPEVPNNGSHVLSQKDLFGNVYVLGSVFRLS